MARTNRQSGSRSSNSSSGSAGTRHGKRSNHASSGVMNMARQRPMAAATVAAGAAAAGLFLWSKRARISEQLSSLSNQISEWTETMGSSAIEYFDHRDDTGLTRASRTVRPRSGMNETGGGNASLGQTSSGGTTSNASGRGRAQAIAPMQQ